MTNQSIEIKLKFKKIGFSSNEEFFETLGILCRNDCTVITGRRSAAQYTSGSIDGSDFKEITNSFSIKCYLTINYTKAIYDSLKNNNIIYCADYIRYLMSEFRFNFAPNGCIDSYGNEVKNRIISPGNIKIKEIIEKKYNEYLFSFEKGLNATKITNI